MMDKLKDLYEAAKLAPKKDYRVYSDFARKLQYLGLTSAQHLNAQLELVKILEV